MLISEWMTRDVITVTPETSMMKASKILKEKNIRRLPVVDDNGKMVGIVTDRDIKEASPSKATTLDVHELYYLLSEIKIKDIMTKNPFCVNEKGTVEKAAVVMREKKVEGLPVVDDDEKVVGIITETDIFNVMIDITGVYHGALQMGFKLPNTPGSLKEILSDLRASKARIISILTSYEQGGPDTRHVYIRIADMDKSEEKQLQKSLQEKYNLMYWVRDTVHPTAL
ncbi:CBS and ACT domain-containing protein [Desulfoplanes formicivorans]|uniref:Membrane protein n=1 Tax=Desulfoplanes formicivorans TaxID=1592317 RepID=A0A194AKU3_9BACT|nr:CBS and ACT domain-containing protein [Desulfoplanes formicivorans]GAU09661.1 membrane protein [Desulfoplanes formicivorans]